MHRLNRTEYGNAVRDLLDLEVDVTDLLPADDESNGFDNIAGVLRVSPSLLEQYLGGRAQDQQPRRRHRHGRRAPRRIRIPPDDSQEDHVEGLPLGTRGGLLFRHNFPQDAEYEFSVFLLRNIVGYMTGLEFAHQLEISIDGERVFAAQVGGEEDNLASDTNMSETANKIDERLKTRVQGEGRTAHGRRDVRQAQRRRVGRAAAAARAQSRSAEHERPAADRSRQRDRPVQPDRSRRHAEPPAHLRLPPGAGGARKPPCARTILSTLARRAYRRPVTDADMAPILALYEAGRKKGIVRRRHRAGAAADPRQPEVPVPHRERRRRRRRRPRVSDLELASRLSFFLWSSIPDDELLDARGAGHARASRRCSSGRSSGCSPIRSRARSSTTSPASGCCCATCKGHIPTPGDFPNFDNELRQAFRTGDGAVLREHHARRPQRPRSDQRRLHVRERAAGAALRHPERLRQPLPPRDADERRAPRPARPGQHADGDVVSEPHVAGAARQVHPREHPRHAAAGAAAERAGTCRRTSRARKPKSLRARLELHRAHADLRHAATA